VKLDQIFVSFSLHILTLLINQVIDGIIDINKNERAINKTIN